MDSKSRNYLLCASITASCSDKYDGLFGISSGKAIINKVNSTNNYLDHNSAYCLAFILNDSYINFSNFVNNSAYNVDQTNTYNHGSSNLTIAFSNFINNLQCGIALIYTAIPTLEIYKSSFLNNLGRYMFYVDSNAKIIFRKSCADNMTSVGQGSFIIDSNTNIYNVKNVKSCPIRLESNELRLYYNEQSMYYALYYACSFAS